MNIAEALKKMRQSDYEWTATAQLKLPNKVVHVYSIWGWRDQYNAPNEELNRTTFVDGHTGSAQDWGVGRIKILSMSPGSNKATISWEDDNSVGAVPLNGWVLEEVDV